jgi:hypothetical protein
MCSTTPTLPRQGECNQLGRLGVIKMPLTTYFWVLLEGFVGFTVEERVFGFVDYRVRKI